MKQINKKIHLQFLASFMITLIFTLPIYSSSVFAQIADGRGIVNPQTALPSIPDPGQACLEKNLKTGALVDILENDIINVLADILEVLRVMVIVWDFGKYSIDSTILISEVTGFEAQADKLAKYRNDMDNPLKGGFRGLINYLVACKLPDVPTLCNLPFDIAGEDVSVNPFSNIYAAVGCLCLPGILFQMRKLQTIYRTYNCCIEQACLSGIGTESCEASLSENLCKFWGKGALFGSLLGLILGLAKNLVYKWLIEEHVKKLPTWAGTLIDLANIPFQIQALTNAFGKIQQTFSEPTCTDFDFDKLKEQSKKERVTQNCRYVSVDINNDGISDRLDYVCGAPLVPI